MTTVTKSFTVHQGIKIEQKFLAELEAIFPESFSAKIYPDDAGKIILVKINTDAALELETIKNLVAVAAGWDLPLKVSRSGSGLRIVFGK
jgi:hypothetical protein